MMDLKRRPDSREAFPGEAHWNPKAEIRRRRPWLRELDPLQMDISLMGGGDGGGSGGGGGAGGYGGGGGPAPGSSAAAANLAAVGGGGYNKAPHLFPTYDFLNLDQFGTIALPAISASVFGVILSFRIPRGRNARIGAIGIDFVANGGAAFVQGVVPATLVFTIQADGFPLPGYEQINFLPGAVSAPTSIAGLMVKERQLITVQVRNVSLAVNTQFVAARLLGYSYSKKLEPQILGYQ